MKEHATKFTLPPCPVCGQRCTMYKNASCRFQLKCKNCGEHTEWTTKSEAIIQWYDKIIRVLRVLRSK